MVEQEQSSSQDKESENNKKNEDQEEAQWDDEDEGDETAYLLHLKFDPEMLGKGSDPILLLKDLKKLGDLDIIPHLGKLPDLKNFNPEEIQLWWSAKLVTTHPVEEIEDILIFFQDGKNDVKFELAETPPEDPGLASFGIYDDQDNRDLEQVRIDEAGEKSIPTPELVPNEIVEQKTEKSG